MLDPYFKTALASGRWRELVAHAVRYGIPLPALASALAYFDGYRSARLPAHLLQAPHDYFGAHTYERVDTRARSSSTSTGPDLKRPQQPA